MSRVTRKRLDQFLRREIGCRIGLADPGNKYEGCGGVMRRPCACVPLLGLQLPRTESNIQRACEDGVDASTAAKTAWNFYGNIGAQPNEFISHNAHRAQRGARATDLQGGGKAACWEQHAKNRGYDDGPA